MDRMDGIGWVEKATRTPDQSLHFCGQGNLFGGQTVDQGQKRKTKKSDWNVKKFFPMAWDLGLVGLVGREIILACYLLVYCTYLLGNATR